MTLYSRNGGFFAALVALASSITPAFSSAAASLRHLPYRAEQSGFSGKRTRLSVKAFKRAAAKRRNQVRHRKACRA